jgi:hypothetical protein
LDRLLVEEDVLLGEEERRPLRIDELQLVLDERGVGPLEVLLAQVMTF